MKLKLKRVGNGGFTIIETLIVLTITGFTILIAVQQLSGRTNDVRYRDSAAQLESFIGQQISQITQGAALSIGNEGTGSCDQAIDINQCIFLGRVLEFSPNSSEVTVHSMFGSLFSGIDSGSGILSESLADARPLSLSQSTHSLDWGLEYLGEPANANTGAGTTNSLYVGYFRLPQSPGLVPIRFISSSGGVDVLNAPSSYVAGATQSSAGQDFEASLCFGGINGDFARLDLGTDNSNESISINVDAGSECNI